MARSECGDALHAVLPVLHRITGEKGTRARGAARHRVEDTLNKILQEVLLLKLLDLETQATGAGLLPLKRSGGHGAHMRDSWFPPRLRVWCATRTA